MGRIRLLCHWLKHPAILTVMVAFVAAITVSCGRGGNDTAERIFHWRIRTDPPSIDPIHCTDTTSATMVFRMFEGLVELDPETLDVIPALAERWEVSPDGLTYTFHLKRGVRFHNGREVTAGDFRWSFERCLTPANTSERSWILAPIAGAEAILDGKATVLSGMATPDDSTIVLTLDRPFAPFLQYLSLEAARVVARESVTPEGFTPIGTGPFRFIAWEHDISLSLEAFPEYHGKQPGIRRIDYDIIPDVGAAYQAFAAGELDLVDEIPPGQLARIRERFPDALKTWPFLRNEYIGFNHTRPPFKGNQKLRQALSWAVDRERIVNDLYEGAAVVATGVLPPGMPGRDDSLKGYGYDLDRARKLLAEAGYPGGKGLPELTLWYNTNEMHQQNVQYIQSTFAEIGVTIRLKSLDWAAYIKACDNLEPDMYRMGWVADIPDADNFLYILLDSAQIGPPGNYSGYANPAFDRLVEEARSSTDPARRLELYRQADRLATEDACWIHLMYSMQRILVNPDYEGLVLPPQGDFRIPIERLRYRGEEQ